MGYDLHITRASRWTDSESRPITEAEWRAHVESDPELEMTDAAEARTPGGTVRYESPGLAIWTAHPGGDKVWLDARHGAVVVKNPDEATIAKMISVARALGARVVGDDGETYDVPGEPPREASPSWTGRVASWLRRLRPAPSLAPASLPFGVGDRVRDFLGREASVVAVDLSANHGLGSVRVRFDDGRELSFAAQAHGLTRVDEAR